MAEEAALQGAGLSWTVWNIWVRISELFVLSVLSSDICKLENCTLNVECGMYLGTGGIPLVVKRRRHGMVNYIAVGDRYLGRPDTLP